MARNIVVIGGGPAAVFAAIEAKKKDGTANVTLVTDEACEPYEKPPLSKAVLLGKAKPEDAPIAGPGGLAAHGVTVKLNTRCTAIDRTARQIVTTGGALPYDALVIATGSLMRQLPLLPPGMPRVHYLRTEAHARAIKAGLASCKHLVVIGAGLIGLEAAASAAELGIEVTVIEYAPRIMARACDEETGAMILAEHQHHGVDFDLAASVTQVTAQLDGTIALETSDGELYVADLVLVGTGVKPDDALAKAAGLDVQDGIVVDAQCRTSDPNIFAAGDATRFATPQGAVRLENWRHAQDHGAVAGRNAAGGSDSYSTVPSYWSEQYDLYIQGVGWPDPAAQKIRRPLPDKSALLLETKDGVVSYALGINAQRDLAAVRRLIERKIPVDAEALADPAKPFNAMLKAKVQIMSDKVTVAALQQMKRDGQKIAGVVAWDTPMAKIADRAGVDLVSVGDSVGVNLWGHDDPLQVTMDEMLIVCKAVRRGTTRALVSCDLPYGPVQQSPKAAIAAAERLMKDGGADMIKVDAAADFPDAVRALVEAGIPVFAQFGLTPQTAAKHGIPYSAQNSPNAQATAEAAAKLVEEALMLEQAGACALDFTNSGPVAGAAVVKAVKIPVIGGFGGGPWLDGRVRLAHTAIGYSDKWLDSKTDTYVNTAKAALGAFTTLIADVRAGRQIKG